MSHPKFDRHKLYFKKLTERQNKVDITRDKVDTGHKPSAPDKETIRLIGKTAEKIRLARKSGNQVIIAFGAHTIKNGLAPVLISLMNKGWITHLATNGAGIIHDWEFAYQGKSSEDVRENVKHGQFGIWHETGFFINLALLVGAYEGLGYGESVGRMISRQGLDIPGIDFLKDEAIKNLDSDPERASSAIELSGAIRRFGLKEGFMEIPHPFREFSVQAAAYELGIPFTGHPMIGHDIIYTHPINNGHAVGVTALNDFLSFARSVSEIDHGVYISLGSAVMSPMIFEKSLSMARNLLLKINKTIDHHFMLVVDLAKSDWNWNKDGEPPMDNPAYYMRYLKTFSRMGGEMEYLSADNRDFLVHLHRVLTEN